MRSYIEAINDPETIQSDSVRGTLVYFIAIPRWSQVRPVGAKEPRMKIINNKEPISVSNESTVILVSCNRYLSWERNKLSSIIITDEILFFLKERQRY